MQERKLARLIAAQHIMKEWKGIEFDRVSVDERGVPYVDGEQLDLTARTRITILGMILLDCVGNPHTERDVIDKIKDHPYHREDFCWLKRYLGQGKIGAPLGEFLELRATTVTAE